MPMRDQMKKGSRTAFISMALCMVWVSSPARADDCRDSLIAESCACQSVVGSERERLSASDKTSPRKKEARARHRVKARIARGSGPRIAPNENSVELDGR